MVGQQTLTLLIGVRVPVSQPLLNPRPPSSGVFQFGNPVVFVLVSCVHFRTEPTLEKCPRLCAPIAVAHRFLHGSPEPKYSQVQLRVSVPASHSMFAE